MLIPLAFFAGSGLLWIGALRAYARNSYSATRSLGLMCSTGITAIAIVLSVVVPAKAGLTSPQILMLLSGFTFAGVSVTFGMAGRKQRTA